MKIIFVLPKEGLKKPQLERAVRSIRYRFPNPECLDWAVPKGDYEKYRKTFPEKTIVKREDREKLKKYGTVVFLEREKEFVPTAYGLFKHQRVYKIDYMGKLYRCGALDETDYPYYESHIFNKAGPRHDDNFYYFPYGYLFRLTGMGPVNELNFRTTRDFDALARREENHKLIVVFGGSAAWSIYSHFEEMFAYRLEAKLNAKSEEGKAGVRFTVVNLATPGNIVLNEMLTYVLFAQRMKPDLVIAHDGFNDFYYGRLSDPYLLNKYDLSYQFNLEAWSQMLHQTTDVPLVWSRDKNPTINYPRSIVDAYIARQKQFQEIVEGCGSLFVAALQPFIYSKGAVSPEEAKWLEYYKPKAEPYKNMLYLYQKYLERLPRNALHHFVNFHGHFEAFGGSVSLFGDVMHTLPLGDERIAQFYAGYIERHFLSRWVPKAGGTGR